MPKTVVKSDGSKQPFDIKKIRNAVRNAAEDAGLDEIDINDLIEEMEDIVSSLDMDEISTKEIRKKILTSLKDLEPDVYESWMEYDKDKGKN